MPPVAKTGRPRRYCSARCRDEAYRDRQAADLWEPWDGNVSDTDLARAREEMQPQVDQLLEGAKAAPPEERLARAIVETQYLAQTYHQLGSEVPPALQWRSLRMSETITAALRRFFGGIDDQQT